MTNTNETIENVSEEVIDKYSGKKNQNSIPLNNLSGAELLDAAKKNIFQKDFAAGLDFLIRCYTSGYKKNEVLDLMKEVYYIPNIEEFKKQYLRNINLLKSGQHINGKNFADFNDLTHIFFPNSENKFAIFNKTNEVFEGLYDVFYESKPKLEIENSDKIVIKNVFNSQSLVEIAKSIRLYTDSLEDKKIIYLYYDSFACFMSYLQMMEIDCLLQLKRFRFLFGPEELEKVVFQDQPKAPLIEISSSARLRLDELEKLAAITFYGRSGSMFFQSLLDSHPNIIMIPGAYIMGFYDFWQGEGHSLNKENLINAFVYRYDVLFDVKSSRMIYGCGENAGINNNLEAMGENQDISLGVNKELFIKELKNALEGITIVSRKDFFKAIHLAYFYALGREYHSRRTPIIVFQLHTPSIPRASQILEDFPEATYFQVIREPIQAMGSHIAHYHDSGELDGDLLIWILTQVLVGGGPIFEQCRNNSWSVKLEHLHTCSKEILSSVCDVLGIPWDDILLQSTFDGYKWWNNKGSVRVSGFTDKTITKKHEDIFSSFDKFRLEILLYSKYKIWDYESIDQENYGIEPSVINELLKYPFKFEKLIAKQSQAKQLRDFLILYFPECWKKIRNNDFSKETQLLIPNSEEN
jgi:hypothetical protein